MIHLTVKMADIPFEIMCRDERSHSFFEKYLTDEEPLFCCEITDEDLRREEKYLEAAQRENRVQSGSYTASLENFALHRMIIDELIFHGVLLLHGSALRFDEEAVVFAAPSGTGKSMHTALWRKVYGERVTMIDDDKPFIRKKDGVYQVYGTPWNGKHHLGSNIHAPLKAIVQLTRGETNRMTPMRKPEAFQLLMKQVYAPSDRESKMAVLDICSDLVHTVPFRLLECNMDDDAAVTAMEDIFLQ